MEAVQFPTFLVIGIGRAGTTTLYTALRQHPKVYVSPVKEPRFFVYAGVEEPPTETRDRAVYDKSITDLNEYQALFDAVKNEAEWGEASTTYLHDERAPANIYARIPNVKLIAVLRNPVERAYSHFSMHVRRAQTSAGEFKDAIRDGSHQDPDAYFWNRYIKPGFYHRHLKKYLKYFDRDQLSIYKFEKFIQDKTNVIEDVYSFLGVDSTFRPDISAARNQSGQPASGVLNYLLSGRNPLVQWTRGFIPEWIRTLGVRLKNANLKRMPPLNRQERKALERIYSDDIHLLSDLVEWDPETWMSLNNSSSS
jgi:hypothetical protein